MSCISVYLRLLQFFTSMFRSIHCTSLSPLRLISKYSILLGYPVKAAFLASFLDLFIAIESLHWFCILLLYYCFLSSNVCLLFFSYLVALEELPVPCWTTVVTGGSLPSSWAQRRFQVFTTERATCWGHMPSIPSPINKPIMLTSVP